MQAAPLNPPIRLAATASHYIAGDNVFARERNTLGVEFKGDDGDPCDSITIEDIRVDAAQGVRVVVTRVELIRTGEARIGYTVPDDRAAHPAVVRVSLAQMPCHALEATIQVMRCVLLSCERQQVNVCSE